MSHALSIADRLHDGAQELARAWKPYCDEAAHMDGHTKGCDYRLGGACACGYQRVERAIRDLTTIVNTRDSAQGA